MTSLIAVGTVGRAAFALWFTWAPLAGHSTLVVASLVLELVWLALQARGVSRAWRRMRPQRHPFPSLMHSAASTQRHDLARSSHISRGST